MRRSILCLLLSLLLALTLCACGETAAEPENTSVPVETAPPAEPAAPAETPVPTESPFSADMAYAPAYALFAEIADTLAAEVDARLEANNAALIAENPDGYYMNSNYLVLAYAPFQNEYPALLADFDGADTAPVQEKLRQLWPDAVLSRTAEDCCEAEYTYLDKTGSHVTEKDGVVTVDEVVTERAGRCVWECGENGAFRVRAYLDGELAEFTEFIPQGSDRYLLYTATDMALVQYSDGKVGSFSHVHRIYQPAQDALPADLRPFDLSVLDFFPDGKPAVFGLDEDTQYFLSLDAGLMSYSGRISFQLFNADGEVSGFSWQPIEPIILRG